MHSTSSNGRHKFQISYLSADTLYVAKQEKYTKEILEQAVKESYSIANVLRLLNLKLAGGTQTHIKHKIKMYNIDTSHFTGQGHNKGKISSQRMTANEIFVILPVGSYRRKTHLLRRALLEVGVKHICNSCGLGSTWNGKEINLEINHIDGDFLNCLQANLEFLCPNCHSQEKHSNLPHKFRKQQAPVME